MNDPNSTLPGTANTPRNIGLRAWILAKTYPQYSIPLLAFVVGIIVGRLV